MQLGKEQAKNFKIGLSTFMRENKVPQMQKWIRSREIVISEPEMYLRVREIIKQNKFQ